jgi:hypothetical protein
MAERLEKIDKLVEEHINEINHLLNASYALNDFESNRKVKKLFSKFNKEILQFREYQRLIQYDSKNILHKVAKRISEPTENTVIGLCNDEYRDRLLECEYAANKYDRYFRARELLFYIKNLLATKKRLNK